MNLEQLAREELDRYLPLQDDGRKDWGDVVSRAERKSSRLFARRSQLGGRTLRTTLIAAAVALIVIAPVGAVAYSSGLKAWLTGNPGTPASSAADNSFRRAIARWTGFGGAGPLRHLMSVRAEGDQYGLFGFRVRDEYCLRLSVPSAHPSSATGCVPARALEDATHAVVPAIVDFRFQTGARTTSASFGFTAASVEALSVGTASSTIPAALANDAFLSVTPVQSHPVRALKVTADDTTTVIPVAPVPHGVNALPSTEAIKRVAGPRQAQRHLDGTIGWLSAHETPGDAIPATLAPSVPLTDWFGRMFRPNPQIPAEVIVATGMSSPRTFPTISSQTCVELARGDGAGGGCNASDRPFANDGAVNISQYAQDGSDTYIDVFGLVADEVASLDVYLASGEQIAIPILDNTFAVELPRTGYPARFVARDSGGEVVSSQTLKHDALTPG